MHAEGFVKISLLSILRFCVGCEEYHQGQVEERKLFELEQVVGCQWTLSSKPLPHHPKVLTSWPSKYNTVDHATLYSLNCILPLHPWQM